MLKVGLTWLLTLAVYLDRDGLVTKWEKWGSFFELEINSRQDRAEVLLRKTFPYKYVEVGENLHVDLSAFGFYDRERFLREEPVLKTLITNVKATRTTLGLRFRSLRISANRKKLRSLFRKAHLLMRSTKTGLRRSCAPTRVSAEHV